MEHCDSGNLMPMSAIPPFFLSTSESMYAPYGIIARPSR
jgi:hypothetical protein